MFKRNKGFTLVELMVTITLIGILASVLVPITQVTRQRVQEEELKLALKEIRKAIDDYKQAGDDGRIARSADTTGYPKTLSELVEGVIDIQDSKGKKIFFLRKIPIDPMYMGPKIKPEKMWNIRSYQNDLNNFHYDGDVYDIHSSSTKVGLNGTAYKDW